LKPEKLVNSIRATGTILANEEVDLRPEIAGKIEKIYFQEGSAVRKGDLLVKINDDELRAQVLKLESQRKLAEDKERRRRMLFEKQNISPEDYEIALNELNSIKAEILLNNARVAKTALKAPFDGHIGLRYVSEGSYVSSETRIATLQDVSTVKVDFSIPERYASMVRKGQKIRFRRSGSAEEYSGTIFAIEPRIDLQTRTVQLRAVSPNARGRLIPGAFAEVELVLESFDTALLIPTEALVPELGGQKVFVYRQGIARQQNVQTGIRTDSRVQIIEGLAANDTVITSGILQLAPGLPVQLAEVE
jgi:membrane fusion protein, multidrug efflux system